MVRETYIWIDDPSIFFKNATQFWPSSKLSTIERVNASSRFILYASLALAIYYKRLELLLVGIVAAGAYAYMSKRDIESYAPFALATEVPRSLPPPPVRQQTAVNAFGNPLPGEQLSSAVAPYDPDKASDYYFAGVPRDLFDVGDRNTTPWNFKPLPDRRGYPDFSELAKGRYGTMPQCKQNRSECTGYN